MVVVRVWEEVTGVGNQTGFLKNGVVRALIHFPSHSLFKQYLHFIIIKTECNVFIRIIQVPEGEMPHPGITLLSETFSSHKTRKENYSDVQLPSCWVQEPCVSRLHQIGMQINVHSNLTQSR